MLEFWLAASTGSNTIEPDPLTNSCLLFDNLESPITSDLGKPELESQAKATGKKPAGFKAALCPNAGLHIAHISNSALPMSWFAP